MNTPSTHRSVPIVSFTPDGAAEPVRAQIRSFYKGLDGEDWVAQRPLQAGLADLRLPLRELRARLADKP